MANLAKLEAQRKGLVDLERRCQGHKSGNTGAEQKTRNIPECDRRFRVQDRASERFQDQIIEEIKELEHTKTEEALQLASKEHDLWMYQNGKEEAKRLQRARKPRKDEEMAWAPPRNRSDWPFWEEARKMEESEWRLEPEGEAEVPGIIIVSDAAEGTFVKLDGESRREQVEAKLSRREREREREKERKAPNEEGEEMKSPKRKVIRVESEETQEYEEEEERTFVPSAVGVGGAK